MDGVRGVASLFEDRLFWLELFRSYHQEPHCYPFSFSWGKIINLPSRGQQSNDSHSEHYLLLKRLPSGVVSLLSRTPAVAKNN